MFISLSTLSRRLIFSLSYASLNAELADLSFRVSIFDSRMLCVSLEIESFVSSSTWLVNSTSSFSFFLAVSSFSFSTNSF